MFYPQKYHRLSLLPYAFQLVRGISCCFLTGCCFFQFHYVLVGFAAFFSGFYFIMCGHVIFHAVAVLLCAGIAKLGIILSAGSQQTGDNKYQSRLSHKQYEVKE